MCFARGHNAVTPMSLEQATPRSRAKHSTVEPLHFHITSMSSQGLRRAAHLQVIAELSLLAHTPNKKGDKSHARIQNILSGGPFFTEGRMDVLDQLELIATGIGPLGPIASQGGGYQTSISKET